MSSSLVYTIKVQDASLMRDFINRSLSYNSRIDIDRVIMDTDGVVTLDLTQLGAGDSPSTLFVFASKEITVTINGTEIQVQNFLFMDVTNLTSLSVSCSDAVGAQVLAVVWGS